MNGIGTRGNEFPLQIQREKAWRGYFFLLALMGLSRHRKDRRQLSIFVWQDR